MAHCISTRPPIFPTLRAEKQNPSHSTGMSAQPIVNTPEDAYRCFLATGMDALVLGDTLVVKDGSLTALDSAERERHLARFELD